MRLRLLFLSLLLGLPLAVEAQTSAAPMVAFVVERDLQTASVASPGPDGVSRLADIFRDLGARTRFIRLSDPVPEDVQVVVLPRPLRSLNNQSLARLWRHLERGNHLLLAVDPVGYPDRRIESGRGGLGQLLNNDYGVGLMDTFLAEAWFSSESVVPINGSLISTQPDYLPHPIIAPLAQYQVPVMVWGARTVDVEPFGIASSAHALLITNSAYGETDANVFGRGARLELNIGTDPQGELIVAAVGENARTGSRIAVLGDGEMLLNGYGLSQTVTASGATRPRFPGNIILAQRLAAWLIDLPLESWPGLPAGFTWIAIDGDPADWPTSIPTISGGDAVRAVRAFRNDEYLYLLAEADAQAMRLTLTPRLSASPPVELVAADGAVVAEGMGLLPDAAFAAGVWLEARIPLRVIGNSDVMEITALCVTAPEADTESCLGQTVSVTRISERDPVPLRISDRPLLTVSNPASPSTNLRSGPGTNFSAISAQPNGTIMSVLGRDANSEWVYAENARYSGWISVPLVVLTVDVTALPVYSIP